MEGTWPSESRRPSRGGGGTKVSVGPARIRSKVSSFERPMHRRQRVSREGPAGERLSACGKAKANQATRTRPSMLPNRSMSSRVLEDTSFARFTDPCPPSQRTQVSLGISKASRSGKSEQSEGTGTGVRRNQERCCAAHRSTTFSQEKQLAGSEKEDGLRRRPREESRVVGAGPVRRSSCRNR